MKNVKLIYMIAGIIAAIISTKYIMTNLMLDFRIKKILEEITERYNKYVAQNVERIYRLETANFTSNQFKKTFSPGMMAFGNSYPWGWKTLNEIFWLKNPQYAPSGVEAFKENAGLSGTGGGVKMFVKFPTLKGAMFTVAAFLNYYGNNPGRWYSTNVEEQAKYNKALGKIELQFT